MEFLLGIFTGYFLTWPTLIILFVLGAIAESTESHATAMLFGIVTAIAGYFFFNLDFMSIVLWVVAYFIFGFVWSIWRYYRYVSAAVEKIQNEYAHVDTCLKGIAWYEPNRMLGTLTTWVLIWPFSMAENVLGDVVKLVKTVIGTFLRGVYHKIYENAVNEIKESSAEYVKIHSSETSNNMG